MGEDELQRLLQEINKVPKPHRETNIFAIGGRGYYENPASDLLGFFLYPAEEHGFGDLVLSSLIESLPDPKPSQLGLEEPPEREYVTQGGNRIDLILNGSGWVIVLENKLKHAPNNPFAEYRTSVDADARFAGKQKHYVVLAPYQPNVADWMWVDYRKLVGRLRDQLGARFIASGISKWAVLLREFLISIEDELGVVMDNQKFELVRNNYASIVAAMTLHNDYINAVMEKMRAVGAEALGADQISIRRNDWKEYGIALRVFLAQDRKHNATLLVCPDGKFRVQFYVQENMRQTGTERPDFTCGGRFKDMGSEANNSLWIFFRDEETLESALDALKEALSLLRAKTK